MVLSTEQHEQHQLSKQLHWFEKVATRVRRRPRMEVGRMPKMTQKRVWQSRKSLGLSEICGKMEI